MGKLGFRAIAACEVASGFRYESWVLCGARRDPIAFMTIASSMIPEDLVCGRIGAWLARQEAAMKWSLWA